MSEGYGASPCQCVGIISERDPRADIWLRVTGKREVPLKHPLFLSGIHNGQTMTFLEGDPRRLTDAQKEALFVEMEQKFGVPADAVRQDVEKGILPIRADNVTVSVCERHRRCML